MAAFHNVNVSCLWSPKSLYLQLYWCIGPNSDLFATQNSAASFMTRLSYWNAPLQAQ